MEDNHVIQLIEFLVPGLVLAKQRATKAFCLQEEDRPSETNYRWTSDFLVRMLFWLQDAYVLIRRFQAELASKPPWQWMIADPAAKANFCILAQEIEVQLNANNLVLEQRLLSQHQLISSVHNASASTANMLRGEMNNMRATLERLPVTVADAFGAMLPAVLEANNRTVEQCVKRSVCEMLRRMTAVACDEEYFCREYEATRTPLRPQTPLSPPARNSAARAEQPLQETPIGGCTPRGAAASTGRYAACDHRCPRASPPSAQAPSVSIPNLTPSTTATPQVANGAASTPSRGVAGQAPASRLVCNSEQAFGEQTERPHDHQAVLEALAGSMNSAGVAGATPAAAPAGAAGATPAAAPAGAAGVSQSIRYERMLAVAFRAHNRWPLE